MSLFFCPLCGTVHVCLISKFLTPYVERLKAWLQHFGPLDSHSRLQKEDLRQRAANEKQPLLQ